jgi:GTP-binding protein HflX
VSALSGEGVAELIEQVAAQLTQGHRRYRIELDPSDGAGAAWLHQHGEVIEHSVEDGRAIYEVRMAPKDHERFETRGT